MSAHTRIDIAAHDAGWTVENHGYTWVYSAPAPDDLAVGTQYTLTGRPRRPQARIGGTLRPITGHNTTGQIIAIIETSTAPTDPNQRPQDRTDPPDPAPPRSQGDPGGTATADASAKSTAPRNRTHVQQPTQPERENYP